MMNVEVISTLLSTQTYFCLESGNREATHFPQQVIVIRGGVEGLLCPDLLRPQEDPPPSFSGVPLRRALMWVSKSYF